MEDADNLRSRTANSHQYPLHRCPAKKQPIVCGVAELRQNPALKVTIAERFCGMGVACSAKHSLTPIVLRRSPLELDRGILLVGSGSCGAPGNLCLKAERINAQHYGNQRDINKAFWHREPIELDTT